MVKLGIFVLFAILAATFPAFSQTQNERLILKDGSYQIVREYHVIGGRVRYFSAERAEWEELPANMVDWAATKEWAKDHVSGASPTSPASSDAVEIDQEEQQDRAEQRARTPEVRPGLHLPDQVGVWALDTFQGQPELVELVQNSGDVNQDTGHNVLRGALNPQGEIKQQVQISGSMSKVQLHVDEPALYVSLTTPDAGDADSGYGTITVDTHGAGSAKDGNSYSSPSSRYIIVPVQTNLRHNYRAVRGVQIQWTGDSISKTEEVIPTTSQLLPGKHWMKLTPRQSLTIGEYALVEILSPGEVNLSVWDFRIDPQGPENKSAIVPLRPLGP